MISNFKEIIAKFLKISIYRIRIKINYIDIFFFFSGAPQDYYLHEGSVFSIAFQPGSEKVFVTACDDGQLQLFDRNNPSSPSKFNYI